MPPSPSVLCSVTHDASCLCDGFPSSYHTDCSGSTSFSGEGAFGGGYFGGGSDLVMTVEMVMVDAMAKVMAITMSKAAAAVVVVVMACQVLLAQEVSEVQSSCPWLIILCCN